MKKKTTVPNDNNLEKVGIFWRKKKLTMSIQKKTSHPEEIDEKWTGNRKNQKETIGKVLYLWMI